MFRLSRVYHRGWVAGLVLAVLLAAACRRSESSGKGTTAPSDLAGVMGERNPVRRLHELANWVATQSEEALGKAFLKAPRDTQGELGWLIALRLEQLHPGEDERTRAMRWEKILQGEGLAAPPEKPTVRERLLKLAHADPRGALAGVHAEHLHPNDAHELRVAILKEVAKSDPRLAFTLLQERRDVDRAEVGSALAKAWGRQAPQEALKWLATQPHSYATDVLGAAVLKGWAETDLPAAMEAAATLPITEANQYTVRSITEQWLRSDPKQAAEWLAKQPKLDPIIVIAAINALDDSNPALAAQIYTTQFPPGRQSEYGDRLVASWVQKDPQACVDWLRTLKQGEFYFRSMAAAAEALAREKPAAAIALMNELPADADRRQMILDIGQAIADPRVAVDWLVTLPESTTVNEVLRRLIAQMSDKDPDALLELAGRLPPGPRQAAVYAGVAEAKFSRDPDKAIAWIKTLDNPSYRDAIVASVGSQWAEADPRGAAEFVRGLAPGEGRERMVAWVAAALIQKDPAAAVDWSLALAESYAARIAVGNAFGALARYESEKAVQKATALPPGKIRDEALLSTVIALAGTRTDLGVQVVMQSSSKEQLALAERLTYNWSQHDLPASLAWIGTLTTGALRDQAILGLADRAAEASPSNALALAGTMDDEGRRYSATYRVLWAWYGKNPEEALAMLGTVKLTDQHRENILGRLKARTQ
jgi:hypothetical protein